MRMWQAYRSRRYLLRITVVMTFLLITVLAAASLALQYNAERNAIRMQQEANRKLMGQIRINLGYLSGVFNNLAISFYMDPNIVPLLNLRSPDEMLMIRSMNSLKQAYLSSSFLHSILIYNGFDDRTYEVGKLGLNKSDSAMNGQLLLLLKNGEQLPRMRLIPMNFSGKAQSVDFFSLVMYQNFNTVNTGNESALVVNIKPEWLEENLRSFSDFARPDQSGLYILDEHGDVLLSSNQQPLPRQSEMKRVLMAKTAAGTEAIGTYSGKLGGDTEFIVTYLNMKDTNWKIVSVQPYEAVLGHIREMRDTFISVIIGILLLALGLSAIVAHKLYKPIERMIGAIGIKPEEGGSYGSARKDELSAVAGVFSLMVQELRRASTEQDKQRHIIKSYYLRTLISNSTSWSATEFEENIKLNGLQIDPSGPFRLILIKVDDYLEFVRRTNHTERQLFYFAISNIAEEIMRPSKYLCEMAEMRSDQLALLISSAGGDVDEVELEPLLQNIQEVIYSFYKLSLTLTVSEPCDSYKKITEQYTAAIQYSSYRLVIGPQAIITKKRINRILRHPEYRFPEEAEKKLGESLRANNLPAMQSALAPIISYLSHCQYDHILQGILNLVDIFKLAVKDINKNRIVPLDVDLSSLNHQVMEKETLTDVGRLFDQLCEEIHHKLDQPGNGRNKALMDAIKEIIEDNYKQPSLSLQGIASMLNMTPAYIGRMFKLSEYASVSEYLNTVRLQHAQAYLEMKNISIKQIMEHVGYVNESTFFKLFKKSFGVTPKEYRLKKKLE